MKKPVLAAVLLLLGMAGVEVRAQGYASPTRLAERLRSLNAQHKTSTALQSLAKSPGGNDVWLLTLSRGNAAQKPALLLVAGVEGSHLAGTELALQVAYNWLNTDSLARLLDTRTLYILPALNPDAQAQATSPLKWERSGNGRPTDDDRDGRLDEDGPEDLNGDGLISTIRVEDPTGQYMPSKADARVLVKADPTKGEQGRYRLITEGIDNDKDGQFNEDGPGGINLNRNFSFDYEPFKPGTGEYAVSEPENQALIDWLYTVPNVYAIVTFGPGNNLSEALKFDKQKASARILKGWLEPDAAVNDQVSKLYVGAGMKDAPALPFQPGDFPQWAYFHFGKLSFSTPGWWVPKAEASKDTAKTVNAPKPGAGPGRPGGGADAKPGEGSDEVALLKWATGNNVTAFIDWKPITHPDFPGQKAELGGLLPFSKLNPPVAQLTESATKHTSFLANVAKAMPQIELVNVKTEAVSPGLSRITVDLHNRGLLPSQAELAERMKYAPKIKLTLSLAKGQRILSGRAVQLHRETIPANGTVSFSWLVAGAGGVSIEAGSPVVGVSKTSVQLK